MKPLQPRFITAHRTRSVGEGIPLALNQKLLRAQLQVGLEALLGSVQIVASRRKILIPNLRILMGTLSPWFRILTLALHDIKARA
jgi:hypothetical protein